MAYRELHHMQPAHMLLLLLSVRLSERRVKSQIIATWHQFVCQVRKNLE